MVNNKLLTVEEYKKQIKQIKEQLKQNEEELQKIKMIEDAIKQLPLKKSEELRKIKRYHIKPWKDPESLFCDTEFLEKYLGKKMSKGDECKD